MTTFPKDFTWGVATASFQIEGAANEDGRGVSIWDTFCRAPGKVLNGDTGEVACDHYRRWEGDLELLKGLGVDAYRFSVAWPRILPQGTGTVNECGLDFYDRLVDGLLACGIEPHCTLYHWDLPQALEDSGGWTNREIVDAFVRYAGVVTRRLGDRVRSYATLNEPWCSAILGYEKGEHAPGHKDRKLALQAAHHLLLAHGAALPLMRSNAPRAQHGIVLNLNPVYPASKTPQDMAAAQRFDGIFNRWFLTPIFDRHYPDDIWQGYGQDVPEVAPGDLKTIGAAIDFLGVNYYSRSVIAHDPLGAWPHLGGVNVEAERTGMGWEVYPQGLSDLLVRLKNDYNVPLYITENGAAYDDRLEAGSVVDRERTSYLERHIEAVKQALRCGVDVRGYFAWSLLDNFEWAYGYSKRFGLFYVDYETQRRIPKASADWYRAFISSQREGVFLADYHT